VIFPVDPEGAQHRKNPFGTIPMTKIAIIYHSLYGHTKLQAEAVYRGAHSVPSITAQLYTAAEAAERLDELDSADAIILGPLERVRPILLR
jgi:flavorubredoxin